MNRKSCLPYLSLAVAIGVGILVGRADSQETGARAPQFRGFIRLGPEQVSFQPCGTPWSRRWWFATASPDGRTPQNWKLAADILDAQPRCDLATMPCRLQEVYVEIDGKLTDRGRFGHLGAYERRLDLVHVHYASKSARGTCTQPD